MRDKLWKGALAARLLGTPAVGVGGAGGPHAGPPTPTRRSSSSVACLVAFTLIGGSNVQAPVLRLLQGCGAPGGQGVEVWVLQTLLPPGAPR